MTEPRVWLADLTHTGRGIASEVFPYGIGCLAEYLVSTDTIDRAALQIIKYPQELVRLVAVEQEPPLLIGFSNYMWNSRLSLAFAARLARRWPQSVIVFGGPHYPLTEDERAEFLRAHPQIHFYVEHEGEQVLAALIKALKAGSTPEQLHNTIGGLHSIGRGDEAYLPPAPPRLASLDAVPSPYVSGLMDPYFTGELIPLLETNRGCPFKCTFCSEGVSYYNRVTRRAGERIRDELLYIGQRLAPLLAEGRARNELVLADSNFGMFAQDQEVCQAIAECQDRYGWPAYVNATTGKNRKEQVLRAIKTARGAIELTGSVQSLDEDVLKNVRRANIRTDALLDVVLEARRSDNATLCEVILGLPGDSRQSHDKSMKDLVRAGFDNIRPYQLCFLPGTEVASKETRRQFGLIGRFRIMPRCFGIYEWADGEVIRVTEVDEICVSQDSMSFEDYIACRTFDLFVHLFHNDGPFVVLEQLLVEKGLDIGDWIEACMETNRPSAFTTLVEHFVADTKNQLHDTPAELTSFVERPEIMAQHIEGRLGYNLLHTYRGRVFAECFRDMVEVAEAAVLRVLSDAGLATPAVRDFVRASTTYHVARSEGVLDDSPEPHRVVTLDYDIPGYLEAAGRRTAESFRLSVSQTYQLSLSPVQQVSLAYDAEIENNEASGRGRLLARTLPGSLWRNVVHS